MRIKAHCVLIVENNDCIVRMVRQIVRAGGAKLACAHALNVTEAHEAIEAIGGMDELQAAIVDLEHGGAALVEKLIAENVPTVVLAEDIEQGRMAMEEWPEAQIIIKPDTSRLFRMLGGETSFA